MGDVANNVLYFLSSVLSRQHIRLYFFLQRVINFSVSVQIITLGNFHLVSVLGVLGEEKENGVVLIDISSAGCDSRSRWEVQEEGGGRTVGCGNKSSDALTKRASWSQRTSAPVTRREQRTKVVSRLHPRAVFPWPMWRMPGNWNPSLLP